MHREHLGDEVAVNTYQWISSFPSKFLAQELNHSLKPIRGSDFVKVLLHDWRIAHRSEADDHCISRVSRVQEAIRLG